MNAFNKTELENDDSGLLESCDFCNALITGWEVLNNSFLTENCFVMCRNCHEATLKVIIED